MGGLAEAVGGVGRGGGQWMGDWIGQWPGRDEACA